jgi:hypothetical protein
MTTPSWSSATPGQATLSGQVNQFLAVHNAKYTYAGSLVNTVSAVSQSDSLGTNGRLSYRFQTSNVASSLNLGWVAVTLGKVNAGCDVYVTLQGDTGEGPDGVVYASCYIPAEWLPSGEQTTIPTTGFPLNYSMSSSTYYNIVFTPVPIAPCVVPNINDVLLTHSSDSTGAYTYTGIGWTAKSYGYAIRIYSTLQTALASTSNLVNVYEGDGALHKRYQYNASNLISSVQEWAAKYTSAPFNLLCRDDASFESSIGTFTATGGSVATSTTLAYDGTHSAELTISGTPASANISTALTNQSTGVKYIPVTTGSHYSAVAYIAPASTLRKIRVDIAWYTGAQVLITTSQGVLTAETAVNTFTPAYNANALAPANAVLAKIIVNVIPATGNLVSGEIHYIDAIGMFANSNTVWSYPGSGVSSTISLSYNAANAPISAS